MAATIATEAPVSAAKPSKPWYKVLYVQVLIAIVLGALVGWLAFGMKLGVEKAWLVGIAPFLAASLIKNALGAALVPAIRRIFDARG